MIALCCDKSIQSYFYFVFKRISGFNGISQLNRTDALKIHEENKSSILLPYLRVYEGEVYGAEQTDVRNAKNKQTDFAGPTRGQRYIHFEFVYCSINLYFIMRFA